MIEQDLPGDTKQTNSLSVMVIVSILVAMIAVMVMTAVNRPQDFYSAWLAAALWSWSLCMGALVLRMIHGLTGGLWGEAIWPWMQVLIRLLPCVAILFIPWGLGLHELYSWSDPKTFAGIENVSHRIWYFQPWFVISRTVFYFVVWTVLSFLAAGPPKVFWKPETFQSSATKPVPAIIGGEVTAGLGLVTLLVTITWAIMDWIMSLNPFFMSTLFGAMVGIGAVLSGLALLVLAFSLRLPPIEDQTPTQKRALSDLANLLLAFVMLWAYLALSQFLIMWSGDLPIEALFYQTRNHGLWNLVTIGLVLSGFAIPLSCLLSRNFKKSAKSVGILAIVLICIRMIELWWLIIPHSESQAAKFNWAALPAAITVGVLTFQILRGPWCNGRIETCGEETSNA